MSLVTPRKGYKSVPWLFGKEIEIPEEWELEQLEKFSNITMGMSPPSESYNENQEGLPFYQGITDFGENYPNTTMWCSDPKKIAEKDQILFSVRAPVGETNITNEQSCLGRGVCSINPLDNELMYCYFLISYFKKQFVVYAQGTTYDAINRNEIARTKLPFTSNKNEQQKIANILSNVDNLIESTNQVITHSKKVKNGLMQKLLTQGIGHVTFKKVPWLFGKEIEIPDEWEMKKFEKIAEFLGGFAFHSSDYIENGIQLLRQGNLQNHKLDLDKDPKFLSNQHALDFKKFIINSGDIVISLTGTLEKKDYGYAVLISSNQKKMLLNQRMAKISPSQNIDPIFLTFLMNHPNFESQFYRLEAGTKQANVSLQDIKKINIIAPSLPEQQKIATILSNIDSKITSQEQYKEKLEKLKKSLMQKLLTGEVRV